MKKKSNINEYIRAEQLNIITKALRVGFCDHPDWNIHGLGYQCARCGYYTGTNTILNKIIKIIRR